MSRREGSQNVPTSPVANRSASKLIYSPRGVGSPASKRQRIDTFSPSLLGSGTTPTSPRKVSSGTRLFSDASLSASSPSAAPPSTGVMDRFIPSRAGFNEQLAMLHMTTGMAATTAAAAAAAADPSTTTSTAAANSTTASLSEPLQSEFNARLAGVLLEVDPSVALPPRPRKPPTAASSSLVLATSSSSTSSPAKVASSSSSSSSSSPSKLFRYRSPAALPSSSTALFGSPARHAHTHTATEDTDMGANFRAYLARQGVPAKKVRVVPSSAERVLDAPDMVDDYYLNLLHWSATNVLAVGLASSIYTWNAESGSITCLFETKQPDQSVTALRWGPDGRMLAIGLDNSKIVVWDTETNQAVRTLTGHFSRVCSLQWPSPTMLTSGSRDRLVINHDLRTPEATTSVLRGHHEEVCGLAWSLDGADQLASGGNDNVCCIWDRCKLDKPRVVIREHKAAIKALAWCPYQPHLLATGAGTADRHIRFFNTSSGSCVRQIDTKSQVCGLIWSVTHKELMSAHGFSLYQLSLWKYPSMTPVGSLTGHTSRVLHVTLSPDGSTVCSGAADETLRFWNVWEPLRKRGASSSSSLSSASASSSLLTSSSSSPARSAAWEDDDDDAAGGSEATLAASSPAAMLAHAATDTSSSLPSSSSLSSSSSSSSSSSGAAAASPLASPSSKAKLNSSWLNLR